jgi:two-component system OmpR family sensor kinase
MARQQGAEADVLPEHRHDPFTAVADRVRLTPTRITLVYVAFGLTGLIVSDVVAPAVLSGNTLAEFQAAKGGVEVILTAGLLYLLTSSSHSSLRRTVAAAERSRTELQLLHRVLRHNLRNNLTLVLGNARQLREELEDPPLREYCDTVVAAAEEIERWSRQTDEIRRITRDSKPVDVDLGETIRGVVEAGEYEDVADLTLSIPENATAEVPPQFELAIDELLSNAVAHGADGEPEVRVGVGSQGGNAVIEIRDDGPGFPEHVLAAVNGRGEDQLVHLDGLGLWTAYLIVADAGGDLVLENRPDGATVRVTVPSG